MYAFLAEYTCILPVAVQEMVKNDESFFKDLARHESLSDVELVLCVQSCLRNMERVADDTSSVDAALRLLLVPEMCERLMPGARSELRRISSSIAEYDPDPKKPSIFHRIVFNRSPWGTAHRSKTAERMYRWRQEGASFRSQIQLLSEFSADALGGRGC